MKHVCVYCGSSDKIHNFYLDAALHLGQVLAEGGYTLVYGAGSTGVMGALAQSVIQSGGEVWGVIPKMFNTPQLANKNITRYEVVENIHVRKARMIEISDAFIAFPGGFGTFEELFEVITWAQIGLHRKPIGLLNLGGYYDDLLRMITRAEKEGFIYSEHKSLFSVSKSPRELLDALSMHEFPEGLERWVNRDT